MTTFIVPGTRVIYESPCKRVRVERDGPRAYIVYTDNAHRSTHVYSFQAEAAAHAWLNDQRAHRPASPTQQPPFSRADRWALVTALTDMTMDTVAATWEIQAERHICDDPIDTQRHGTEIGTAFRCGSIEVYIPDTGHWGPGVYAFGNDAVPFDAVLRDVPALMALMLNPTVRDAVTQWAARCQQRETASA